MEGVKTALNVERGMDLLRSMKVKGAGHAGNAE